MQLNSAPGRLPKRGMALLGLFAISASTAFAIAPTTAVATTTAAAAEADETTPVVQSGETTWRYLDTDVDPSSIGATEPVDPQDSAWALPSYDDSAWQSAAGSFGVKRSGSTVSAIYSSSLTADNLINYFGQDGSSVVQTHYYRTTVTLTEAQLAEADYFSAETLSDDGIIIYINGVEVARNDVPADTATLGYASGSTTSLDEFNFRVAKDLLVAGENTIAVAVHQDRAASSDSFFDFIALTATQAATEGATEVAAPTRLILTPTETPEQSQSFTWLASSESATTGVVEIKPADGGAVRSVKAYNQGTPLETTLPHYSTTITGLDAATDYTYRVGNGSGSTASWSKWYTFTTATANASDFTYLYYGDAQIGLDTTWPEVVRQATEQAPDAVGSVHAGDLIDTSSNDTQWRNWFTGMETAAATTNVMAAPGNHEFSGDKLLEQWKAHFEYPLNQPSLFTIGELAQLADGDTDVARQYAAYFAHWSDFAAETVYYTDYQGVRFITINATRDTTFLTPDDLPDCVGTEANPCPATNVARLWTEYQAQWLDYVLENSDEKWNVVTFHQPVYSTSSGRDEPVLRELWVPVFEKHNIDLVQMGHDHTYARGYNDATATETEGITTGPVYVVSNSGAKHYNLETDEKNVWTNNEATQVKRAQGLTTYQVIDVTANTMTYRSYIAEVDAEYNSVPGAQVGDVYDEFTITKTDDGVKYVTEAGIEAPIDVDEDGSDADADGTDVDTDTETDGTDVDTDTETDGTDVDTDTDTETDVDGSDADTETDVEVDATELPDTDVSVSESDDPLAQTGAGQMVATVGFIAAMLAGGAALFILRRKVKEDM